MPTEIASYVALLDGTKPPAGDPLQEGDDHLRLIKSTLVASFPNVNGAVSATHTQLSYVTGVTSAIQTQLNTKSPLASPTFTGVPAGPTAAFGTRTTQLATTNFVGQELTQAVSAGGIVDWAAGTFVDRAVRRDPTNGFVYVKVGAGSSTLAPSLEGAAWAVINRSLPVVVWGVASFTALRGTVNAITNNVAHTISCPPTPSAGDYFEILVLNNRTDNVVARNGSTMMDLTLDLLIDRSYTHLGFTFVNGSWRIK